MNEQIFCTVHILMKPSIHSDVRWFFRCKLMALERRCTDGVERLKTQLYSGISHTDLWDKTVSFFTPKKTPIFYDGYSKYSRETLRLFPAPDEDVLPLCFQQWWTLRLKQQQQQHASTVKMGVFLLWNGKEFRNLAACKVFCKDRFCSAHNSVGLLFCPQMGHRHCYLAAKRFSIICKENGEQVHGTHVNDEQKIWMKAIFLWQRNHLYAINAKPKL